MQIIKDIANLFFPELCLSCDSVLTINEQIVCTFCNIDLPLTDYTDLKNNSLEKTFYGRVDIVDATALFYYAKKGKIKRLIHNLKYFGYQNIGAFFGKWLGEEISQSSRFKNIDFIIPVPLHEKRLKSRGYNQLTKFGEQLSIITKIPYRDNVLIRINAANTQSKKIRLDRWKNVSEMFFIANFNILKNKHILLIDDIITTGATIETCCNELNKIENIKISIAVMAYTK